VCYTLYIVLYIATSVLGAKKSKN